MKKSQHIAIAIAKKTLKLLNCCTYARNDLRNNRREFTQQLAQRIATICATDYHHGVMRHTTIPILLFGAFDRHNFGDLLFAHVATRLLDGRHVLFAGLAERDLRACGGHRVKNVLRLASRWCNRSLDIVHVGGELLTCSAWEAAVMLLPQDEVQTIFARFDATPNERMHWAQEQLGLLSHVSTSFMPYVLPRSMFPKTASMIFHAVGGVDLDALDAAMRSEVLEKLRCADHVSVRDGRTHSHLAAAGIAAELVPDPAVMTAELFGPQILSRTMQGEAARIAQAFPQGYLAVQCSADFGNDRTLNDIAAQLDEAVDATSLGIAFFRAGAAPWHDDIACYERITVRMRSRAAIFHSLDLWDICALVAGSRAYLGSSLHGRIIAMAYALPRVNLRHPAHGKRMTKQEAYAATWDVPEMPGAIDVPAIVDGLRAALAVNRERLQQVAIELVAEYQHGFDAVSRHLAPL